jgi:hypothetical protein
MKRGATRLETPSPTTYCGTWRSQAVECGRGRGRFGGPRSGAVALHVALYGLRRGGAASKEIDRIKSSIHNVHALEACWLKQLRCSWKWKWFLVRVDCPSSSDVIPPGPPGIKPRYLLTDEGNSGHTYQINMPRNLEGFWGPTPTH